MSHAKARQRVAGVPPVVATAAQRRKGKFMKLSRVYAMPKRVTDIGKGNDY